MAQQLIAEIRVDAAMMEAMQANLALAFGRLLREHAEEPGTPPVVAAWVGRATAAIEQEFQKQ